ncbi:MAG TPA: chemotaxis protein CheB [Anaerolineae bacterium]|nr:chemotaxis protein CheB [Anaerolineae bacterium]
MAQRLERRKPPPFSGAFDVVAVAASAGGLVALKEILGGLPANFPAALVIVQHLDPRHPSLMATILARHTLLEVKEAENRDRLRAGTAFVAPPNRHLLVNSDGSLSLTQTELVHFLRPSADLLFESVAASFKTRAIAVVLTGSGTDGSIGVQAIKKTGGTVIVQDRATSEFPSMPQSALETGCVDLVLPLSQIAPKLLQLVARVKAA